MKARGISLVIAVVLVVCAGAAEGSLALYYNFNEGTGTTVTDLSGNGYDGTINGAIWTQGYEGWALEFDDVTDSVVSATFPTGDVLTVMMWIKMSKLETTGSAKQMFNGDGPPHMNFEITTAGKLMGRFYNGSTNVSLTGGDVPVGEWKHVAWVYDYPNGRSEIFIDGQSSVLGEAPYAMKHTAPLWLGRHTTATNSSYPGVMDEVRIYDEGLTAGQIRAAMLDVSPVRAGSPQPRNEAPDASRDAMLGWTAGKYAATHDVYFGTAFEDVNDADRAHPLNVLVSQVSRIG